MASVPGKSFGASISELSANTQQATGELGMSAASKWAGWNAASRGFLNPTAIGAGAGMVAGGAYGGLSEDGSVLGGMAGGALLGAGLGAGGYAGYNKFKFGTFTRPLMLGAPQEGAKPMRTVA